MRHSIRACILFLLLASPVYAQDIGFDLPVAAQMVVEIEQCRIQGAEIKLQGEAISNLEQQVGLKDEIIALQREAIEAGRQAGENYRLLVNTQKDLYETAIKKARPNFFEEVIKDFGFLGIGVLVGVFLL